MAAVQWNGLFCSISFPFFVFFCDVTEPAFGMARANGT